MSPTPTKIPPLEGGGEAAGGCPCSGWLDIPLAFSPRALSPFKFKGGIFSCSAAPPWRHGKLP
jgi:hypothetical protein